MPQPSFKMRRHGAACQYQVRIKQKNVLLFFKSCRGQTPAGIPQGFSLGLLHERSAALYLVSQLHCDASFQLLSLKFNEHDPLTCPRQVRLRFKTLLTQLLLQPLLQP